MASVKAPAPQEQKVEGESSDASLAVGGGFELPPACGGHSAAIGPADRHGLLLLLLRGGGRLRAPARVRIPLGGTWRGRPPCMSQIMKSVYLDGSSAMEQKPVVNADGEVLLVRRATGARVAHVGVIVADVADSARQRDGSLYARHSYRAGPVPSTMPHHTSAMTPSTPASHHIRRSRALSPAASSSSFAAILSG
ncbi:hypothetical protein OsJ_04661 [Oryza sativa Japonica Group]|uniref:Uncharacterized protein n=1 Tax=Oryza sativa subsp. japonica TaxID=39947 RepID=B9EW20_ORYSJ|nr:hypothetical protein OsJ_04661 [Oryza sativa Japonica Group]